MVNPIKVAQGAVNDLLGLNQNISEKRMKICKICPIYSSKMGGMCNHKLWFNPATNEISLTKKPGFVNGCGCKLSFKTTLSGESCPGGKW